MYVTVVTHSHRSDNIFAIDASAPQRFQRRQRQYRHQFDNMDILGLIEISNWILILLGLFISYYVYMTWPYDTFKRLNIPYEKPWPIIGDMGNAMRKGILERDVELARKYRGEPCFGSFLCRVPTLTVTDPNMLKAILVKEFDSFTNRQRYNFDVYPMRRAISNLMDDDWQHMRNILTPTFSAGKLKQMMCQINRSANQLAKNLGEKATSGEVISLKDYTGPYTLDVIASTGFGMHLDSQTNKEDPFVKNATKALSLSLFNPILLLILLFPPSRKITGLLNRGLFPKEIIDFFVSVIDQAIARRQELHMTQEDLLQLMLDKFVNDPDKNSPDFRDGDCGAWSVKGLTKEDILGQSLIFMLAGYDTTSTTLAFMGYCLATNPDVQDKLIEEVDRVMGDASEPTYDVLKDMVYLEQCINETLRLYPPAIRTMRFSKRDVIIERVKIPKGIMIFIPVYAIHHDPEKWEDPEAFKPERFNTENKGEDFHYKFMPFGTGPRNCIGMRLALVEAKVAMVHVLRKYKFVTCAETEIPLKLTTVGLLGTKNGIKLNVVKRVED